MHLSKCTLTGPSCRRSFAPSTTFIPQMVQFSYTYTFDVQICTFYFCTQAPLLHIKWYSQLATFCTFYLSLKLQIVFIKWYRKLSIFAPLMCKFADIIFASKHHTFCIFACCWILCILLHTSTTFVVTIQWRLIAGLRQPRKSGDH